jgi:hypothetical protein
MLRLYYIIFLFLFINSSAQQPPDFIMVKKRNGRVLQYFVEGSSITYLTIFDRQVTGPILSIRNDSIFVRMYDIRPVVNSFDIMYLDTLGSSIVSNSVNDIIRIQIHKRKGLLINTLARISIVGGATYFVLNIFNGAYLNDPITSPANVRRLGISAGVFGIGMLIKKVFKTENLYNSKHDRIEYIHMKNIPSR